VTSALLTLAGVSKVYGAHDTEVYALHDVDLEVAPGEFVALMGPSGSGKSTCLNVLGCLDLPSSGRYFFRGVDVARLDADGRALLRRHFIGFVFQGFNLVPRTTALENVELPLLYRGVSKAERRRATLEAFVAVGLAGRERHVPAELSGGQQQRVAIARALVTNPSVLLADEPTGNLDSARSHEIMQLLARLNRERGLTIVMVTHEPDMAAYAGRVVSFRDGRIVDDRRNTAAVPPAPLAPPEEARAS
jgi:putative ABC transport system ATP-binding protein